MCLNAVPWGQSTGNAVSLPLVKTSINISQESVTSVAESNSRSSANYPPDQKTPTLLISSEINTCVLIFVTSLCTQVFLPLGCTPTH